MAYNNYQKSNNNQKKAKFNLDDYVQVNERIDIFWKKFPNGRIHTELLKWQDKVILMKAEVYKNVEDEKPFAIGHAYEVEGSTFINKGSAIENAETSAVGRALGIAGFEITKSVASREEVAQAKYNQQQDKQKPQPKSDKQQANNNDMKSNYTPEQIQNLKARYIQGKGSDEGFEKWAFSMIDKGYTYEQIFGYLHKLLQNKQQNVG